MPDSQKAPWVIDQIAYWTYASPDLDYSSINGSGIKTVEPQLSDVLGKLTKATRLSEENNVTFILSKDKWEVGGHILSHDFHVRKLFVKNVDKNSTSFGRDVACFSRVILDRLLVQIMQYFTSISNSIRHALFILTRLLSILYFIISQTR